MTGWSDKPADFWEHAETVCTPRELDVLRLRAQGVTNRYRIALTLGISETRVRQLTQQSQARLNGTALPACLPPR